MDEYQAVTMWKCGWGNMNDALSDEACNGRPVHPRHRAIKSDWKLHRMPRTRAHFELGIEITDEEFETLAWGHIPEAMEDHWFMYFDGEAFCFHRSWTGYCIYRVYVRRADGGNGYVLHRVTANRKKDQFDEDNDERDAVMVAILIGQALGKDVKALWKQFFEMGK